MGMPVNDLAVANGPANDQNSSSLSQIRGRISGISSSQQAMWATLGFTADAELFTDTGSLYGDLQNGDIVVDDAGIRYRVTGRARRIAKGSIPDFWRYPLSSTSTT